MIIWIELRYMPKRCYISLKIILFIIHVENTRLYKSTVFKTF